MKLRNKKTGEIAELHFIEDKEYHFTVSPEDPADMCLYKKLADITEEWEDYEEPKGSALELMILTLTNFIENEPDENKVDLDDCKQLLEKLKAWKRLKDARVRFDECRPEYQRFEIYYVMPERDVKEYDQIFADIYLLFGGEE